MKHDIVFFEDTHEYIVDGQDNVPSVTTILKPLTDRGYANINPSVLETARLRGSAVHEALENLDYDIDPEIMPEIIPYIQAYEEWKSVYRPTWTGIEQIVFSGLHGFIGTLDRVGLLNGKELSIVDLKTSNPSKEALCAVCIQTAAYELAYIETPEGNKMRSEYGINIHRYGLFLKSDGSYRFLDCEEYEKKYKFSGFKVFYGLLKTNRMITEILERKGK